MILKLSVLTIGLMTGAIVHLTPLFLAILLADVLAKMKRKHVSYNRV